MAETENRALNDKFMLRLPDGMRDRIRAAAEANGRSMNSEIIECLSEKYPAPARVEPETLVQTLLDIAKLTDEERKAFERAVQKRLGDRIRAGVRDKTQNLAILTNFEHLRELLGLKDDNA